MQAVKRDPRRNFRHGPPILYFRFKMNMNGSFSLNGKTNESLRCLEMLRDVAGESFLEGYEKTQIQRIEKLQNAPGKSSGMRALKLAMDIAGYSLEP